jgi:hypothetical protein
MDGTDFIPEIKCIVKYRQPIKYVQGKTSINICNQQDPAALSAGYPQYTLPPPWMQTSPAAHDCITHLPLSHSAKLAPLHPDAPAEHGAPAVGQLPVGVAVVLVVVEVVVVVEVTVVKVVGTLVVLDVVVVVVGVEVDVVVEVELTVVVEPDPEPSAARTPCKNPLLAIT